MERAILVFEVVPNMPIALLKYVQINSNHRRGGVEVERSPRMREIGVRFQVATDLSPKNR